MHRREIDGFAIHVDWAKRPPSSTWRVANTASDPYTHTPASSSINPGAAPIDPIDEIEPTIGAGDYGYERSGRYPSQHHHHHQPQQPQQEYRRRGADYDSSYNDYPVAQQHDRYSSTNRYPSTGRGGYDYAPRRHHQDYAAAPAPSRYDQSYYPPAPSQGPNEYRPAMNRRQSTGGAGYDYPPAPAQGGRDRRHSHSEEYSSYPVHGGDRGRSRSPARRGSYQRDNNGGRDTYRSGEYNRDSRDSAAYREPRDGRDGRDSYTEKKHSSFRTSNGTRDRYYPRTDAPESYGSHNNRQSYPNHGNTDTERDREPYSSSRNSRTTSRTDRERDASVRHEEYRMDRDHHDKSVSRRTSRATSPAVSHEHHEHGDLDRAEHQAAVVEVAQE